MMKEKIDFIWGWICSWWHVVIQHEVHQTIEDGKIGFIACADCEKFFYKSKKNKNMSVDSLNEFIKRRKQNAL